MNIREKLVELLNHEFGKRVSEITADYLIANGVTVLPEGAIVLTKEEIAALNEYQKQHFTGGEQVEG